MKCIVKRGAFDINIWTDVYSWFYENIPLELRPTVKYDDDNGNWIIDFKREQDKVEFILKWL